MWWPIDTTPDSNGGEVHLSASLATKSYEPKIYFQLFLSCLLGGDVVIVGPKFQLPPFGLSF